MPAAPPALTAVAPRLRCPTCGEPLAAADATLRCAAGHAFDIAREGYVSLLAPARKVPEGDDAAMVAARTAVLDAGHFDPVAAALAEAVRSALPPGGEERPLVADLGAGTGHHLAAVLDALPEADGVALDVSRPALRRAARRHPRMAAVRCDVWRGLPLRDGTAAVALDVFAPRNGPEIARVLAPGGALVVVTPAPEHLAELRGPLGLLEVDAAKRERLRTGLRGLDAAAPPRAVRFALRLDRETAGALAAMGPSARHAAPGELERRVATLPGAVDVTASVLVETFRAQ